MKCLTQDAEEKVERSSTDYSTGRPRGVTVIKVRRLGILTPRGLPPSAMKERGLFPRKGLKKDASLSKGHRGRAKKNPPRRPEGEQ